MACRVEARDLGPNATWHEREVAFTKLFKAFKRKVDEAKILRDYKSHEFYESPGEKRRRKKREAQNQRFKSESKQMGYEKNKSKRES